MTENDNNVPLIVCHLHTKSVKRATLRDGPLFPPGGGGGRGIVISRRQEFFPPSIERLQVFSSTPAVQTIFLKFPKSCITWVVSADNFFQMNLWSRQFISAFFHMQTIFVQITIPLGKIMVLPLVLSK